MADKFVKTGLCPRCNSTRTLALLADDDDTRVFIRGCCSCGHEWDKSPEAERVDKITMAQFHQSLADGAQEEAADNERWLAAGRSPEE